MSKSASVSSFNDVSLAAQEEKASSFPGERWVALLGGAGLALFGLRRKNLPGAVLASAGGYLLYSGLTSESPLRDAARLTPTVVMVKKTVTINRPAAEIFEFCRDVTNYPKFMQHIESVQQIGFERTHWVASPRFGPNYEWDSKLTEVRENELIAWETVPGSGIESAGLLRLRPAPGNRGTEVHLFQVYKPPFGKLGQSVATLVGEEAEQHVRESLRHLKQLLEAGEIATTRGQTSGKRSLTDQAFQKLLGERDGQRSRAA